MIEQSWRSERLDRAVRLLRWSEIGTPVLVFPTAGDDAEHVERVGMIDALGPLMTDGRIKVYSVDSIAGTAWLDDGDPLHAASVRSQFDQMIRWEAIPAIRTTDRPRSRPSPPKWGLARTTPSRPCAPPRRGAGGDRDERLVRPHPTPRRRLVGRRVLRLADPSPSGAHRERTRASPPAAGVVGERDGANENAAQSWWLADVLGSTDIPNRVDN